MAGGGAERDCLNLCNGWVALGLEVELLLAQAVGPYLAELNPAVRVIDLNAARALKAFLPLIRHLRSRRPVPTLIMGFEYAFGLIAARRFGLVSSQLIFRESSSPLANVPRIYRLGYKWLIRHADAVVAQNVSAASELERLGVARSTIRVIPNPCPHRLILSVPAHQVWRQEEHQGPLLVAAGRLNSAKGFKRLISAFSRLRTSFPDARLTILGEGSERTSLEQEIINLRLEGRVELPGFVADISNWYRQANVFVLSSHYEGQPNALIEAILHGCPVLCAEARGGVGELLRACGLAECLLPDSQFEELFAAGIQRILSMDSALWRQARERLIALAHPDKVCEAYLDACGLANRIQTRPQP
jgi:glycosyltransferase involved in cell wall biosynthesis